MARENLRDALNPKPRSTAHYKSKHCELIGCACRNQGKPEVAIHDRDGNPIGYVCQVGYANHIGERRLDQQHTWRETGAVIKPHQSTAAEQRGMQHVAQIVSDFDSYAESRIHMEGQE